MHASDSLPHAPDSGQNSLSTELNKRIHEASKSPESALALLEELLGPRFEEAMEHMLFEAQAVEQAAMLLGGEWTP